MQYWLLVVTTSAILHPDALVARLRAAGCVFAEDEARILVEAAADEGTLESLVVRRERGEPLETIVGWVELAGMRLAVAPGVFVPRQRSARIARAAVAVVAGLVAGGHEHPVVFEACCGVAPIAALVAARVPSARIAAFDIDPVAAATARANLPAAATVLVGDGLDVLPTGLRGRVALIAAVPPYVPDGERRLMPHDTFDHESASAVLGGADGLDAARELLRAAPRWLAPGGRILLELHRSQVPTAAAFARAQGFVTRRRAVAADGQTGLLDAEWW